MPEILRKGNPDRLDPIFVGTCPQCDCRVKFRRSESRSGDQREPGYYIPCPETGCSGHIWGTLVEPPSPRQDPLA